ncbi:TIGR01457 family HAD-type hydrolase [Staphylococcus hominis]|uniref:TIGR01457 family HAD-type hydrolase n=1 Tax=Staphylococcus hominis TaxID=1290 RepID=UPI000E0213D8|nr:TIGR01457 family HAD-type hydrolase [Staphylococcus hominis]SUM73045.1 N-acetyl-glucosamine catabolism-like protein [Staphylococcus hominis]
MKNYKGYLIDLDGTMYMGTAEIDGAAQFIDYLNKNDIPHLYVTNNSTKTPEEVTEKLKEMKIDAKPDEVVTSALATANYIAEESSQASVYMIGGNGLRTALTDADLTVKEDENVDYVVIGLDEAVTYEKLAIATLAVRKGAKFISTNPDVSIPKERGFLPGNGAITSVVSVSTGQQPQFIGKPETIIMQIALDILKLDKSEVAMVGDLYDTDIMSGINVGMDTVHVQTGVTSYEEIQTKQPKPTYSFKDLNVAIAELESNTN